MQRPTLEIVNKIIDEFNEAFHGNTDYDEDPYFVMHSDRIIFCPFTYLKKKIPNLKKIDHLLEMGLTFNSYIFAEGNCFREWYEKQFSHKLGSKILKDLSILYRPSHQTIFNALEIVNRNYDILREHNILLNGKNLPIQLGEWYAKCIFGLKQVRSTSQRGFDFEKEGHRVEVKVHWSDGPSPKGAKIRKALIELSEFVVLIYLSKNFMIRDICYLDSDFILRKFAGKGHTIFLKDADISNYFFSKSTKQFVQVVDKMALMTFASPALALKLEERLESLSSIQEITQ